MRILALYPFLPYPAVTGSKLRGSSILEILTSQHEVTLVSLLARDEFPAQLLPWNIYPLFAREPLTVTRLTPEELSPRGQEMRAMLPKPLLGTPEWMEYFDLAGMWNRLAELNLQQFDAVHVRYVSMASYALALKQAAPHLRLVIDLDDILSVIFFRKLVIPRKMSQLHTFLWEVKELIRMVAFESGPLRSFDSVWVCSDQDFRKISRRLGAKRALIVANVVNAAKLASIRRQVTQPALLFIGDFNYHPNGQAAEFFVEKVWPGIKSRVPEAQLWLVGANRQAKMLAWNGQQGIAVTGKVDEVTPYLERAMVSIAPLLMGVGTRLKILEALGAGLPVVATTIGAEGIEAKDGVDLLIADSADDFADRCVSLLQDAGLRERLAAAGKLLIKEKYDVSTMSEKVLRCYDPG